jgi:hypothetical protein
MAADLGMSETQAEIVWRGLEKRGLVRREGKRLIVNDPPTKGDQ